MYIRDENFYKVMSDFRREAFEKAAEQERWLKEARLAHQERRSMGIWDRIISWYKVAFQSEKQQPCPDCPPMSV